MRFNLEFLKVQKGRDGRPRYAYFRRNGRQWRLPGTWPQNPLTPEFLAEYRRLLELTSSEHQAGGVDDRREFQRGTFGRLVLDYLASGDFKEKAPRTQVGYRHICDELSRDHGRKLVRDMERRHVRIIRDAKSATPGAANNVLRMLKILLNFAVDDGLIVASPAAKMKEFRVGEWRDWSDDECARFEARWAPGTMQRRAYAVLLYTGQRIGDVVAMERAARSDGLIAVATQKTGEALWIPEHRELTAELARGVTHISHLLSTPTEGKPFHPVYFGAWFADAIDKAGLPEDCVTHGLRKCAARTLADVGCTTEQIKAIIGHRTDRMVAHYVKTAETKARARAAMAKWNKAKTGSGKRPRP